MLVNPYFDISASLIINVHIYFPSLVTTEAIIYVEFQNLFLSVMNHNVSFSALFCHFSKY